MNLLILGPRVPWIDEPEINHGAGGKRDVLFLVSNIPTTDNPDIVPRRSKGPLTEKERRKLEEQGIHRDMQHTDLGIMTARETLDKQRTIVDVLTGYRATCEGIKSRIANLMHNTDKEGGRYTECTVTN